MRGPLRHLLVCHYPTGAFDRPFVDNWAGKEAKMFFVPLRAFQALRGQTRTDTATYLSYLELYDCTNTDILNLTQSATLFDKKTVTKVFFVPPSRPLVDKGS